MGQFIPVDHDPFDVAPTPQGTQTPTGYVQMPPGMRPSGMTDTPSQGGSMVPMSDATERGMQLMTIGGITKNRALEAAGQHLITNDPTAEARKAQATEIGKGRGQAQTEYINRKFAGARILRALDKLEETVSTAEKDRLEGAIGPYNMNPSPDADKHWLPTLTTIPGMTPPQAAAAGKQMPWWSPQGWMVQKYGNADAWDLQNTLRHDTHGVTTAFMTSAGKGMNMSDERQKAFDATMSDFQRATTKEQALDILRRAKNIVGTDFNLNDKEISSPEVRAYLMHLEDQVYGAPDTKNAQKVETAPYQAKPTVYDEAREAIARGANPDAVAERLRRNGYDPKHLK